MAEKTKNGDVISDSIIGKQEDGKSLFMVVWQRIANSGISYVWAKDEKEASEFVGYQKHGSKHVLATVVKIDQFSMPVQYGRIG